MNLTSRIRLSFVRELVSAEAELLWGEAPKTCEAVLEGLPISGVSHHAIYSGSECVLLLPQVLRLASENATTQVTRGDVAFVCMAAGSHYGVSNDFAEIIWFYDIDAQPRMWEGPVPVNIFARVVEPAERYHAVCRCLHTARAKLCRLEIRTPQC